MLPVRTSVSTSNGTRQTQRSGPPRVERDSHTGQTETVEKSTPESAFAVTRTFALTRGRFAVNLRLSRPARRPPSGNVAPSKRHRDRCGRRESPRASLVIYRRLDKAARTALVTGKF
ncbi:unnamed protein product, partial [Iphiclides podalirius]